MPFLRWLTIIKAISGPFPSCLLPTPRLPNLLWLSIEGNFSKCMALVDHISCPPLGTLRLKCINVSSGPTLKRLSSMTEKRLSLWRTPAKTDRDFIFKCLRDNAILVTNSHQFGSLWGVSESEGYYDALRDPVLSMELFFGNPEDMESSALPFLLAFSHILATVSRLTFRLDLTTEHIFNRLRLLEAFHLFNSVEEINLFNNSSIVLLPLLQAPHSEPPMNYLPSLRVLFLTEIDFGHGQGSAFNFLVSYVQHRQQVLAPVKRVGTIFSSINRTQLEIFKQLTGVNLIVDFQ